MTKAHRGTVTKPGKRNTGYRDPQRPHRAGAKKEVGVSDTSAAQATPGRLSGRHASHVPQEQLTLASLAVLFKL